MRWAGIAGWAVFKAVYSDTHPTKFKVDGGFVGKVGDSRTGVLIPRKYIPFKNKWGDAWAVHFDDADGNHYLTFSSSRKLVDAVRNSIGKGISLNFTVVGQEVDRGWNMNRIKATVQ